MFEIGSCHDPRTPSGTTTDRVGVYPSATGTGTQGVEYLGYEMDPETSPRSHSLAPLAGDLSRVQDSLGPVVALSTAGTPAWGRQLFAIYAHDAAAAIAAGGVIVRKRYTL